MKLSATTALTAALGLAQVSHGINILMNNDDGFGGGNIRELYRLLKGAGHDGKRQTNSPLPSPTMKLYMYK